MDTKPKAGRPKKAPAPKMTKKEQAERFIQTARLIGVDETGVEFEKAVKKIARPRPSGLASPKDS